MVAEGNVVKDFYIGHTHIKICDDSCRDKTPEQVEAILARIARIALGSMIAAAEEKNESLIQSNQKNRECNNVQQNQRAQEPL